MNQPSVDRFSLSDDLARASGRVDDVLRMAREAGRIDLAGLPDGATALMLARLLLDAPQPLLLVTADADAAQRAANNLRFFLGEHNHGPGGPQGADGLGQVLLYPTFDTSPFLDVAVDRRAAMERMAVLFHLAQKLPFRALVVPAAALVRRVPPTEAIAGRSLWVRAEEALDRGELVRILTEGGYLRVPVVEDPGTFAVRGGLIDVYPPYARHPVRIELDDDLVMSLKRFDPEGQRTISATTELWVHPARDSLLGPAEIARAKERVSELCDAMDWPSSRRRALVEDIDQGKQFLGHEGYLPAYYQELQGLTEYLPRETRIALLDPSGIRLAVDDELARAQADRQAKCDDSMPAFPLMAHYLEPTQLARRFKQTALLIVHRMAVSGVGDAASEGPLVEFERTNTAMRLAGEDQRGLRSELKTNRTQPGHSEPLRPLTRRTQHWLDEGLRVLFAARTLTQAERLAGLLRSYGVAVAKPQDARPGQPERTFHPTLLTSRPTAAAEIVVGPLADGFVLASEAIACVTEEEIFGQRGRRRSTTGKSRDKSRAFVEDLRQLEIGDYVVHVDHGIGRYLGLERKTVALSRYEQLQGLKPIAVEVLVVEYAGGDRLLLPVTRLNQIQKFASAAGAKAKLDRLGGQTFSRTKARVQATVRQLADELLALYAARAAQVRPGLAGADRNYAEFEATFPFEETPDQARAIEDVMGDLEGSRAMDRVVCGDVGFGKTEVAIRAAFRAAMGGRQVAVLCPTTVLAHQHVATFRERFRDYPIRVEELSRFVPKKEQTEVVAALKAGQCDVVIGTHRLLSKDVHFKQLGLLVVDEEQRFGVTHKERIKKLKAEVDVLTLSATPIPRTLQMAIGGLRDLSTIATPPTDRRAIRTFVTRWDKQVIKEAIERELLRGGQVFYVYNRIEGLHERAARLQELVPNARIAIVHGQMREATLERIMADFIDGRYDILCSTAIIENGIDISRANTILVDRADTFGLAQLYQIRGRVGRSPTRAYCYLIAPPPDQLSDEARTRIESLQRFSELGSGLQIASLDMELRGTGDLLGAEQSGQVAAVGFDLFIHMLESAIAELRGETPRHEVDPELTFDLEALLPETYIDDVGVRLSLYKRLASAEDEQVVQELAAEMEDRFGQPPREAMQLVRAMGLKPTLRGLRVLGCEATRERVTLHLNDDAPLDAGRLLQLVSADRSWRLTPDRKLTRRFPPDAQGDALDRVRDVIDALEPLRAQPERTREA